MATLGKVDYLVVHCSASKPSQNWSIEDIRAMHKAKGWSDVGYHAVIKRDGTIQYGRPMDVQGAHVLGYNNRSIGICMIGGLDESGTPEDNFTAEQWNSLELLMITLHNFFPKAEILGHRDLSPDIDGDGVIEEHEWLKQCPCFNVDTWWAGRG